FTHPPRCLGRGCPPAAGHPNPGGGGMPGGPGGGGSAGRGGEPGGGPNGGAPVLTCERSSETPLGACDAWRDPSKPQRNWESRKYIATLKRTARSPSARPRRETA